MEELKSKVADLTDHAKETLDTYRRLAVIKFTKQTATITTTAITIFITAAFSLCVLVFIGICLAIWLSTYMHPSLAYLIVAVFYILLIVCFWAFKNKLLLPKIRQILVRKIYG